MFVYLSLGLQSRWTMCITFTALQGRDTTSAKLLWGLKELGVACTDDLEEQESFTLAAVQPTSCCRVACNYLSMKVVPQLRQQV